MTQVTNWGMTGVKSQDIVTDTEEEVNCIGWMLGEDKWLWPGMRGWANDDYVASREVFERVLEERGYVNIDRPCRYDGRYEYVVLYQVDDGISHGARREGDCWVSKLGRGPVVKHKRLEQVRALYGQPMYFYRRRIT